MKSLTFGGFLFLASLSLAAIGLIYASFLSLALLVEWLRDRSKKHRKISID